MNFNLLCLELGISPEQSLSKNLALLKQWVVKHISSDCHFLGDENKQFAQYKRVAEFYFDILLPELTHEHGKESPKLNGETAISVIATMGFDRVLFSLQPESSILNKKNSNGLTPLHLAALAGHLNTTKLLLSMGANKNVLNNRMQYPIFNSLILPIRHNEQLRQSKIAIFNLLNDNELQILSHQDESGNTVVHQMAVQGFDYLLTEILKTHSSLADIKNNHTHYPIHTAILNDNFKCVHVLIGIKNADTLTDSNGWTPLHYAARYANTDILKECYQASNNKNPRDLMGRTPLLLAAQMGRLSVVETLIALGTPTDQTDLAGFNILHYAVQSGNLSIVQWVVENTNIDINAKDSEDRTPLHLCKTTLTEQEKMEKIGTFLLDHGATLPAVYKNY